MQPPRYITPSLGGKSLTVLAISFIATLIVLRLTIDWSISDEDAARNSWQSPVNHWLLLGATFGFGSGLCWVATAAPNPFVRITTRILLVALFGYLLSRLGTPDWVRHAANLAGAVLIQSMLFSWLRVPPWVVASTSRDARRLSARQFQIADLLTMTTALACVLGLAIRYSTPVDSKIYWVVMLMIWLVLPSIAVCAVITTLARSPQQSVLILGLGMGLLVLASLGLSYAETRVPDPPNQSQFAVMVLYGLFLGGYVVTMLCFGIAGRVQTTFDEVATPPVSDRSS